MTSQNNRITGSVQNKKGYWYTVIYVPTMDGKKKQSWKSTGLKAQNNKRKAEGILTERIARYMQQDNVAEQGILFSDFMVSWLDIVKKQIKSNTHHQYSLIIKNSIVPFFEAKRVSLQKLKASDIQVYYDKKLKDGASGNTVKRHHANIHKALKYAVKLELIPNNPAERVELPRKEKFIGKAYTDDQIKLLLDKIKGTPIEVPVFLTVTFGLRRSETMGLKWDAIDLENQRLIINHTVVGNGKQLVAADEVKNSSSRRTLTFGAGVKQYLIAVKKEQETIKRFIGTEYHDSDYVCRWNDGQMMKPDYVSTTFKKLLKKHGLPMIRFHDLRHSVASVLLNKGCDLKQISTWLGHCDISTTANIYAHLQYDSKVEMGNILNDMVFSD